MSQVWKTAGNDCNRNLNNVIYRLKKQLRAAGLPDEDCIQIQDGICTFKVSCPLELDTEYFRNLVLEARRKKRTGTAGMLSESQ